MPVPVGQRRRLNQPYQQHLPLGSQQAQSAFAVEAQALRALRVSTASHQSDALRAARLDPSLLGAVLAELEQE